MDVMKLLEQVKLLRNEAEDHRQRYDDMTLRNSSTYWMGRRDEAGYLRDRLIEIIALAEQKFEESQ